MQAVITQQDAIKELYKSIFQKDDFIKPKPIWLKLKEKRDLCAGHPARQGQKERPIRRAFLSRNFGNYSKIQYELWASDSTGVTHPSFDLGVMI